MNRKPRLLPLNMKGELTRSIYEGRKTQTRRIGDFPADFEFKKILYNEKYGTQAFGTLEGVNDDEWFGYESKYNKGDYLWVRESFQINEPYHSQHPAACPPYHYKAEKSEGIQLLNADWLNPYCMRREQANLFLKVTELRVERLQDITEEDCIKEGILTQQPEQWMDAIGGMLYYDYITKDWIRGPKDSFKSLWQSLKPKPGFTWNDNPWVCVYDIPRVTKEEAYSACNIQP